MTDYLSDRLISVGYSLFGVKRGFMFMKQLVRYLRYLRIPENTRRRSMIMSVKLTARCTCCYDNLSGNVIYGGRFVHVLLGSWGCHRQSRNVGSWQEVKVTAVLEEAHWLHDGKGCCRKRVNRNVCIATNEVYMIVLYTLLFPGPSLPLIASSTKGEVLKGFYQSYHVP